MHGASFDRRPEELQTDAAAGDDHLVVLLGVVPFRDAESAAAVLSLCM
jgi:hypothetical protein